MKIAIGNDHAGYQAKLAVIENLKKDGIEVIDCGCFNEESCDYPDFAKAVCAKINNNEVEYGVLICGSGEGISISANKVKNIRCGLAYNNEVAALMRMHNNANVIAFGARFMTVDEIMERIKIFLSTPFEGGRHSRRVEKIED